MDWECEVNAINKNSWKNIIEGKIESFPRKKVINYLSNIKKPGVCGDGVGWTFQRIHPREGRRGGERRMKAPKASSYPEGGRTREHWRGRQLESYFQEWNKKFIVVSCLACKCWALNSGWYHLEFLFKIKWKNKIGFFFYSTSTSSYLLVLLCWKEK